MPHDSGKYLADIQERADFVLRFMADKSCDDLTNNRVTRSAMERELMVLGEAFFQLHGRFPEIAEQFDGWKEIIRFRHVLVHGYDSLNLRIVWEVIQNDLQPLLDRVNYLLAQRNTES